MAIVAGNNPVCKEICDALGLKHCRKLNIDLACDSLVIIKAECLVEDENIKQLVPMLKRFYLVEKAELGLDACLDAWKIRTYKLKDQNVTAIGDAVMKWQQT